VVAGLLIGKHKSMGCPGKNTRPVLGRPMVEYALIAATHSGYLERLFTSTDSPQIAEIGKRYGADHIERPPELATEDALTENALVHAFAEMQRRSREPIEIVVLLFANAPTIPPGMIDRGVEELRRDSSLDSAFSVCQYDMWSPLRARRLDEEGVIRPYVDPNLVGPASQLSSIRGAEGGCYFVDLAVQVLRAGCFTHMDEGELPFRWMGKRSKALHNDFGFDIDYEWQIPVIEHWLRTHGFTETSTPYDAATEGAA
jgi:CMP-N-acetylneuraminic acid synthetase